MPLGDINANLPRFVWQEVGQAMALGRGDRLSATPHRLIRVEVLERAYAEHPGSATVPTLSLHHQRASQITHRVSARADMPLGRLRLGDEPPVRDVLSLTRLYSLIQAPLPDPAGWEPRLFQRAQLVLSDSTVLGEVNAAPHGGHCFESGRCRRSANWFWVTVPKSSGSQSPRCTLALRCWRYPNPTHCLIRRLASSDCDATASCPVRRWACCISVIQVWWHPPHLGERPPAVTALSGPASPGAGCAGQPHPGRISAK